MQYFNVIVIGSGISGLNFALRAAEKYPRVLVITKKKVAEGSTNFAQGGIAAVLSKVDDYTQHVKDTMTAGAFHNDRRAVEYMVKNGPAAIRRLMELGVPFATLEGKLLLAREGGHGQRRIAFVSDYTGQAIEKVLVERARKNRNITLLEHTFAADLLVKNKTCYGVQILRLGLFENIVSDITVLATGGIGQLFAHTTNPAISTGDGLAMAERAGCLFRDAEFIQFHPTALAIRRGKAPHFLISEAVRGEGAFLRNSKGERFMVGKHPLAELAPRDIVARAIFEEEKSGPVFLDLRHKDGDNLKTRFQQIYSKLKMYGIDMAKDLIPITPAAHYLCGGVRVNLRGETGIGNLYAFGEVSGTGVHGANRLASNSLLEALVFSDRIVKSIQLSHKKPPKFTVPRAAPLSPLQKKKAAALRKKLQQTMWKNVGIVRSKKSLHEAQNSIKKLTAEISHLPLQNLEILELRNMLAAAAIIAAAAQRRKKSLGCHFVTLQDPHRP